MDESGCCINSYSTVSATPPYPFLSRTNSPLFLTHSASVAIFQHYVKKGSEFFKAHSFMQWISHWDSGLLKCDCVRRQEMDGVWVGAVVEY